MFTIDNNLNDLKVKERSIFKIIYSMNSHPVATPEMSVEEARCYILFFSEGPNLSAFIGLYLPGNDRKFFYACASNPFPFEAAGDVEDEARQFAEDMGFLLDEINVSGMPVEDRNQWIEDQFIFGYKKPELPVKSEEPEAEEDEEAEEVEEDVEEVEEDEEEGPPEDRKEPAPAAEEVLSRAKEEKPASQEKKEPPAAVPPPPPTATEPAPPPAQGGYTPQPGQPYPGYPQQMPPQYPLVQTPPELDVPDIIEEEVASSRRAEPPARRSSPPAIQPSAQRRQAREIQEDAFDEEMAAPGSLPRKRIPEAVRSSAGRPSPGRAVSVRGAGNTVARDKEALARLLSSF